MNTLEGLPAIDPAEAQLRCDVLSALNGRAIGDALLSAFLPRRTPPGQRWFRCAGGLALALERLDGQAVLLPHGDAVEAAEWLAGAETLLRQVERALGIELEPEALEAVPPGHDPLFATVDALAHDRILHRIHLALPRELRLVTEAAGLAPELLRMSPFRGVPLAVQLSLAGPRLAPHEAADLAPGDLLLLGPAPLSATVSLPGQAALKGRFDPSTCKFDIHDPITE